MQLAMKSLIVVSALIACAGVVQCEDPQKQELYATDSLWISEVELPDEIEVLEHLSEEGLQEIIAPVGTDAFLRGMGVNILSVTPSAPFWEIEKKFRMEVGNHRQGPAGYNSPAELAAGFNAIVNRFPTLAQLINLNEEYNTPRTIEGRDIFAIKISANVAVDEDEPNVLIVAAHHCRELVTPELVFDQATRLVEGYGVDSFITTLLNTQQIYMIWDQNPDGANYVWTVNNFWRKNRRRNSGGSYGIDLNRNYPVGWDFSCGGSTSQTSETYRGTAPASENETKTMLAFHADRHFAKVLDYHSYARDVRQNYGTCANLPPAVDAFFGQTVNVTAAGMGYIQSRSCCTGGHISAAYAQQGALSMLVEAATAFQPTAPAMREELVRVWPGTVNFLSIPISIQGHVRLNGQPVATVFDIAELNYQVNEVVAYTNLPNARYHLWLPDGTYTFLISYSGGVYREVVTVRQGMTKDFNL